MKRKVLATILQLFADAMQSVTLLILLAIIRYFGKNDLAGDVVIFVSSMNFVATFAGISRDTPFLRFLSSGKKNLAKILSLITGVIQLAIICIIGAMLCFGILPLWVFAGVLFGFYSVTVNELRYIVHPLSYVAIKFTYSAVLILASLYCLQNLYDVRNAFIFASAISVPIFIKHFGMVKISYKHLQFFLKYSSVFKLISYRSLNSGYVWAENIIIKQISSLEVLGSIGIWREVLRLYSFLVQGVNRANAVLLSKEYFNTGNKVRYRKQSARINITLGLIIMLIILGLKVPNYLYLFVLLTLVQNLQHTQSYYFFTKDKIWQLTFIVSTVSFVALLIQLTAISVMQFYSIKLGMVVVIYLVSHLYISKFLNA